jgi:hypothetical protein
MRIAYAPVPGENHEPEGEDDRLVVFGEDARFRRNIQALFYPSGIPLWVSDVLPGNVHDLAACPFTGSPPRYPDEARCLKF